jgi:hypothetical protein
MRRLANFRRLDPTDRWLLIEASLLLGTARLAVRFVPFARIAARLGEHMGETPLSQPRAATDLSRRVGRAVSLAARNLPWESVCLPQAIAAKLMLRRRGVPSTLYLGLQRDQNLLAHAWVRVGEVVVTGEQASEGYTVVSTFA